MSEKISIVDYDGKTYKMEVTPEQAKELEEMGISCSWKGCTSTYSGELPQGWRMIAVYKDDSSKSSILKGEIDGCLCPWHIKELGKLPKLGFKLDLASAEANRDKN